MVGRFESTANPKSRFEFVPGRIGEFKFNQNLNLNLFPNDTELGLALDLELHYILPVFCVRQEDGRGVNRES